MARFALGLFLPFFLLPLFACPKLPERGAQSIESLVGDFTDVLASLPPMQTYMLDQEETAPNLQEIAFEAREALMVTYDQLSLTPINQQAEYLIEKAQGSAESGARLLRSSATPSGILVFYQREFLDNMNGLLAAADWGERLTTDVEIGSAIGDPETLSEASLVLYEETTLTLQSLAPPDPLDPAAERAPIILEVTLSPITRTATGFNLLGLSWILHP